MRNVLRRVALGVLGTGMIVTMAAGATALPASAASRAPAVKTAAMDWPKVRETAQGNRVKTIQYLLNQRGFPVMPIDGIFGKDTKDAVVAFQKKYKLTKDEPGVVGNQTWEALVVVGLHRDQTGVFYAVEAVQSYLRNAYGYKDLPVTGNFGSMTEKDVKAFQASHGIPKPDGKVNLDTWYKLVKDAL